MTLIEQTAYPRFTDEILAEKDLQVLFGSTEEELKFIQQQARKKRGRLTLLMLLKTHQYLGRTIAINKIPRQIHRYLVKELNLPTDISHLEETEANKTSFHRYRKAIRMFLDIQSWSVQAEQLVVQAMEESAFTMSDPADLINISVKILSDNKFEIPAFRRLDDLARQVRQSVHHKIYKQTVQELTIEEKKSLDNLLYIQDENYQTDFSKIKTYPGRNTLPQMRVWARKLDWICSIIVPDKFTKDIKYTKLRQFAAQANQLEVGDLKDFSDSDKRYTFLLCFLQDAQMRTRDELINMFLKRMRQTHSRAKEELEKLKIEYRSWEEQMMETLNKVVDSAAKESKDSNLGKQVRSILDQYGGADIISKRYKLVSAYHGNNHLPLLWNKHKAHRKAIYQLLNLLQIKSTTEDEDLLTAFEFVKQHQNQRSTWLDKSISLDFLSNRWRAYVQTRVEGRQVLKRRELEVCILSHLADGIRCGDLFIVGSEELTDFRTQLLPWNSCLNHLNKYCQAAGLPSTADKLILHLKARLRNACQKADKTFLENTNFTIDEFGQPHLKRLKSKSKPENLKEFQKAIRAKMPERHLLDMLKNVQYWSNFSKHFGPPSGSRTKMKDAVSRYLYTVFGYGCNLGPAQTAKHIKDGITLRVLKRINDQHITAEKLQEALTDIVNEYAHFELPYLWGSGKSAGADGTHIQLIKNNLIGEQHIRYNGYGGIAYHHISDTYIALFCNFIACGVWEAVYILDGLMKNTSKLQPDTVHADTQGQSEPVFGLSYLLGIKLMPRMRNWNNVTFYKVDKRDAYEHIDGLFTDTINWELIAIHWKDLMQVVISINQGKVLPSMLLQKLGTDSRKNKLNKTFRELGRIIRTIFLLEYINSDDIRAKISETTNKVESFHAFHDWITFGGITITTGDPIEQLKRNKYIDLIANAVILHNVVDMTNAINEIIKEGGEVTPELVSFLSPFLTGHIKRFGQYFLDIEDIPQPLDLPKLGFLKKDQLEHIRH